MDGVAVAFVEVATLLVDETPGGAATTMVLNGLVFNLGTSVGAALGGLLIAFGGYDALGLGLPAFARAAGVLVFVPGEPSRDPS